MGPQRRRQGAFCGSLEVTQAEPGSQKHEPARSPGGGSLSPSSSLLWPSFSCLSRGTPEGVSGTGGGTGGCQLFALPRPSGARGWRRWGQVASACPSSLLPQGVEAKAVGLKPSEHALPRCAVRGITAFL